jgi:hypothetical protein
LAQWTRFGIAFAAMLAALAGFMILPSPWDWIVPFAILLTGGILAEHLFRRLATPDIIRDDLEDRVRNPPD